MSFAFLARGVQVLTALSCCLQLCLQAVLTAGTLYPDTSILYVDAFGAFSTARLAGMYDTRTRHAQVGLMMLTCECSTCWPITLREPADKRQTGT